MSEAKQDDTVGARSGRCVLIVDDSQVVRFTVANIVKAMGYDVIEATDGNEVLLAAEEHHPDLVIMDVHMPGKSGIDALRDLRAHARFRNVPVIMLTAAADQQVVRQAAALKISGYLVKSNLKAADIRERLHKIFEEAPAPPPPRRPHRTLHILLATGQAHDQQLIGGLLKNWGHVVQIAQSGREVLALAPQLSMDLVLMDAAMPEMDGFAAAAAIRQQEAEQAGPRKASGGSTGVAAPKRVPIALLTSEPVEVMQRRCQAIGIDACIAKPVSPDNLFAALEEMASPTVPKAARKPAFDRGELMERVDDDLELLERMLELFVRDYPGLLETIRRSIASGDAPKLKNAAHTLKGMLGNLSAHRGFQLAQEIEALDPREEREEAGRTLLGLEKEIERLCRELDLELEQQRGANPQGGAKPQG